MSGMYVLVYLGYALGAWNLVRFWKTSSVFWLAVAAAQLFASSFLHQLLSYSGST